MRAEDRVLVSGLRRTRTDRVSAGGVTSSDDDLVAVEEPLEIRVDGETLAVTMRTPGHDRELAAGLLFCEGVISSRDELGSIAHCGRADEQGYGNTLEVKAAPGARFDLGRLDLARHGTLTTSACGVCGRRSIEDLVQRARPLEDASRFDAATLASLSERLRSEQRLFEHSGGLHAAATADERGNVSVVREDVGRHNAVDKVVGRLLLDGALPARGRALVVSGRVSFEIVQKAVCAGFPLLLAVSAPTSLAVETAGRAGITLIGFCRNGAFNVYAGRERVV
jgi:FdhD protein